MPSRRFALLSLIAILLFASAVYLVNINQVSFWEDESWMAMAVKGDLPHVWTFATERGLHPPLYFILGWFYTRFTGDSELALRWLAGMCALVGIAWTYHLGAAWFGRRAGLYAALLAAGSLFIIYFGRLGRHYTLFFALAVALVYIYWRATSRQSPVISRQPLAKNPVIDATSDHSLLVTHYSSLPTQSLILIAVLQAALLYTHYFGIWMALVIGLHGLLTLPRRDALRLIGALVVSGLAFLPWLPSIILQINGSSGGLGYASQDILLNLRAYLDRVFNGDYALGFTLALLGIVALYRWRKQRVALFLAIWLTIPLILSLLLNTRFAWFIERNMIFTLGGAYVLLGAGLAWLSQYRVGKLLAPVGAIVFVALGFVRYETFWPFITPDWRDMAHAVAQDARPDDLFVLNGEPYSMTYYLDHDMATDVQLTPLKTWLANPTSAARTWLLDANWTVQDAAHKALPADSVMTRQYILGVLVAEFYQRPPPSPLTSFDGQIALGFQPPDALRAYAGSPLTLDLWWRSVQPPASDYSVGVYLVDVNGATVAQQDGGFDNGRVSALALPADHWTPDARSIAIPADLAPGTYTLTTAVYNWHTGDRLTPANGWQNRSFPLGDVQVTGKN